MSYNLLIQTVQIESEKWLLGQLIILETRTDALILQQLYIDF